MKSLLLLLLFILLISCGSVRITADVEPFRRDTVACSVMISMNKADPVFDEYPNAPVYTTVVRGYCARYQLYPNGAFVVESLLDHNRVPFAKNITVWDYKIIGE